MTTDQAARLPSQRAWVAQASTPEELETIHQRLQRQQALDTDGFTAMIEAQVGRLLDDVARSRDV